MRYLLIALCITIGAPALAGPLDETRYCTATPHGTFAAVQLS